MFFTPRGSFAFTFILQLLCFHVSNPAAIPGFFNWSKKNSKSWKQHVASFILYLHLFLTLTHKDNNSSFAKVLILQRAWCAECHKSLYLACHKEHDTLCIMLFAIEPDAQFHKNLQMSWHSIIFVLHSWLLNRCSPLSKSNFSSFSFLEFFLRLFFKEPLFLSSPCTSPKGCHSWDSSAPSHWVVTNRRGWKHMEYTLQLGRDMCKEPR